MYGVVRKSHILEVAKEEVLTTFLCCAIIQAVLNIQSRSLSVAFLLSA